MMMNDQFLGANGQDIEEDWCRVELRQVTTSVRWRGWGWVVGAGGRGKYNKRTLTKL